MKFAPTLALCCGLALWGSVAWSADWRPIAQISKTIGAEAGRLCAATGEANNSGIACPSTAPSLTTAGDVSVTGNVSANKFLGDGSGLTGVTASSADRITSGTTTLVVVSDTEYISLTQSGTNTGWFDPTRGLVTLGVSATGPISGTTGYFSGKVGIGTTSPGAPQFSVGLTPVWAPFQ